MQDHVPGYYLNSWIHLTVGGFYLNNSLFPKQDGDGECIPLAVTGCSYQKAKVNKAF